jgi:golgi SNAP receptor complex member 2
MRINEILTQYERAILASESNPISLKINEIFNETDSNLAKLDNFVLKEPTTRRYDAKMKVDQLKYDFKHYKSAYESIKQRKYEFIIKISIIEILI